MHKTHFKTDAVSPSNALQMIEDANGYVGIGMAASTVPVPSAPLMVSNFAFNPSYPDVIMGIINSTPGGSLTPGNSGISLAVIRSDGSNADPMVDLIVNGAGQTGIGTGDPQALFHALNVQNGLFGTLGTSFLVQRSLIHLIGSGPAYTYTPITDLTVSADGLTGIGVETPVAHLDITDQNNDGLPLLKVTPYGASYMALYVDPAGSVVAHRLSVWQDADVLGDATMHQNLNVNGKTVTNDFQITTGGQSGYLLQSDASGNASWVNPTTIGANLWAASGSEIYNTNSGNVRIPNHDVYLRGGSDANHGLGWYGSVGTDTKLWSTPVSGTSTSVTVDGPVLYGFAGGVLGTTAGGQKTILKWTSSGKVIIGDLPAITASSSLDNNYSLYVQKGIITEKVKVALTAGGSWSDYVFDKDYKLPNLDEVQTYISNHHHLPGVPSAAEVDCDGIDVGSMDATLLKKIEELTLYVLDLKRENAEIKNQMPKK